MINISFKEQYIMESITDNDQIVYTESDEHCLILDDEKDYFFSDIENGDLYSSTAEERNYNTPSNHWKNYLDISQKLETYYFLLPLLNINLLEPKFSFWNSYRENLFENLEFRPFIFKEIKKNLENIEVNLSDLSARFLYYSEIKENFVTLWENRIINEESNELLVMLNQFITNNKPENLNKEQIMILNLSINKLESGIINENDIEKIFDSLIDSGMDFFPTIEGFSDKCDD